MFMTVGAILFSLLGWLILFIIALRILVFIVEHIEIFALILAILIGLVWFISEGGLEWLKPLTTL